MLYHARPLEHIISAGLCGLNTAEGQCQPAQELDTYTHPIDMTDSMLRWLCQWHCLMAC